MQALGHLNGRVAHRPECLPDIPQPPRDATGCACVERMVPVSLMIPRHHHTVTIRFIGIELLGALFRC